MIAITVKLFGPAIDMVEQHSLEYELTEPAKLSDLIELLQIKYPKLAQRSGFLRFAVNSEYAGADHELKQGDEVAVIPPVAGGAVQLVQLTREVISAADLARLVTTPACGGIVTFEGIVRGDESAEGNQLEALEYSAYDEMALKLMSRLRDEARQRFDIHDAAIAHRIGRLAIGECSVAIAVAAPHRPAAFDACRWIIDTLKKDVPIWKKDLWRGGETSWVIPDHGNLNSMG